MSREPDAVVGGAETAAEPTREPSPSISLTGTVAIAAGAVQAFAAGTVADHRAAVTLFAVLGAVQLLWGVAAGRTGSRSFQGIGVVLHLVALNLWLGAATSGLSFVDGLETARGFDATTIVALALSGGAGFAALTQLVGGRAADTLRSPSGQLSWGVTTATVVAVVVAAVGANRPSTASDPGPTPTAPAAPAPTVPGLIGLPTGPGGDIDGQLGELVDATDPTDATSVP